MPVPLKLELIRDRIPVRYRIHALVRGFTILLSGSTALYSVYFLYMHVTAATPLFYKLLPLVIFFVGADSFLRHVLSLNSVTFWEDQLKLGFIAKRSISIPYKSIRSIEIKKQITIYLYIEYVDDKGRNQTFRIKGSFPKVLEIIVNLYDLVPELTLTDKMKQTCEYLMQSARGGQDEVQL